MALARAQAIARTTAASASFASPPSVGNGILVEISQWHGSGTMPSSVTDNRGNVYTLVAQRGSGNSSASIFVCSLIAATGSPFTITVGGAQVWQWSAQEISDVGTGLVLDRIATANGTGTAVSTGAMSALRATDEILAAVVTVPATQASLTVEALSPTWTEEFEFLTYAAFSTVAGEADTRIVSSAVGTTPSANWTLATSGAWVAAAAAFARGVPSTDVRITQEVVETVILPTPDARVSQMVVELLNQTFPPARITQMVVETLTQQPAPARVTQLVVEVLLPVPVGGERSDLWID